MIHLAPVSSARAEGGEQISSFNWGATPLGPLTRWPPALRIAVDMLLLSAYPCALVWGPGLTVIHNPAYPVPPSGRSHALGDSFDALWATAWDDMGAAVFQALEGQGSFSENTLLTVERQGRKEQAWFTCCYSPIRDDQGAVAGFLHALIETTASVESTREWRELAQSFEAQLSLYMAESEHTWQLSPDVMLMLDAQLHVRMANPAWHRLSGLTDEQQTPVALLELIHPAERTEARLALMALMQGHDTPAFEARMRHAEGHYCWLRWHAVPGQALPMLIGRSISEERQSVQRMAQAAVRDSQRMESVVKVAGGLAHEMNNVLSGVGSSLELLERRLAQGRLERLDSYVQMARECAQRAIGLTQNLLAFARSQPLSPNPLDINQLIREAQPMLEQCVGAEMHLNWQLDIAPWPVQLDPDQLRNAMLHLCANARDACLGRGHLSIRTSNERLADATGELPAGDYVMVQVEDDGHGMSADDAARAFEPFFTTKPLGQGSGLGLPMVHGFVRQSGGQVWIESKLQQGTQIVLMFPRYSGSQPIPVASPITLEARHGERVLLIDDELNLRGLIKEILVDRGFEVCDVTDANTALGQYRHAGPFDLVITDIGLPGGFNGRQVARALRMINPEQKILFITGFTEDPVDQHLLDEPGTALLLKPFTLESLVTQVNRMLQA
ncbi:MULTISPECIES: hybrid sensor histidine kinase/response regulator [Pseudomonas]|uniref:hybrid sensor histidine kinase/response regulator n=1 Tax=Pseudomonas TaxID=286 RepID=UPI001E417E5A|nr:hybrid sensor histidine kinase/response regulator [Pseudomonas sp. NMI795_08]MCE1114557.1 ATP-binding protein [Pseudomonas sp. NMI795_08]